jgi:hypothetical protein
MEYASTADDVLDEAGFETSNEGNFESEIFLSTDGKHTIHIKANTPKSRSEAWKWAINTYDLIKEKYGTKQAQSVREYNKEEDLGKCSKCGAKNIRSLKGKVYCSAKCWLS